VDKENNDGGIINKNMSLKRFVGVCIIAMFLGCSIKPAQGAPVSKKIENIYRSSVSLVDVEDRVYGSGTIIFNRVGHRMVVLTASHVVRAFQRKKDNQIYIHVNYDQKPRRMFILKENKDVDLALLVCTRKETTSGPFVKIAMNSSKIGEKIWVIGSPLGEEHVVTNGIVSHFTYIQEIKMTRVTAPIYFGNSGGGLFNENMELIGVAKYIIVKSLNMFSMQVVPGGFFFVHVDEIRKFM
jgi:S1-C subfamily serine protease